MQRISNQLLMQKSPEPTDREFVSKSHSTIFSAKTKEMVAKEMQDKNASPIPLPVVIEEESNERIKPNEREWNEKRGRRKITE